MTQTRTLTTNFATEQKFCFTKVPRAATTIIAGTSLWHNILFTCETKLIN